MKHPPNKVIAVVGPTAIGKTPLGVSLAQELSGEIISADSQLVYRELEIGTAKPTLEERQGIPHHMIDVAAPTEKYSVACYQAKASAILESLLASRSTPVVVGGTGFYIRALLEAQFIPPVPPDETFRAEMALLAEEKGPSYLHQRLQEQDPERAAALHPNDQFRVIRALEIIHATGRPVPKQAEPRQLDITWVGLTVEDRDFLRTRIDARIEAMLSAGWMEEVEQLLNAYGSEVESLQIAHGYPELIQVLQGKITMAEAVAQIQINIHQYARRQLTWFRRNPEIHWFIVDQLSAAELRKHAFRYVLG
jgi:tRNA dimethylallyltransferase